MPVELPMDNDVYQLIAVNREHYAIPVHCVSAILALENVLRLPGTPDWVSGVVHIHNAVVPVVNLNKLIEVEDPALHSHYQLLALLHHPQDSQRWLGLCVTDLTNLMNKTDLAEMPSSSSTHPCLINIVDNNSQKIHILNIANIFEQLMQEQD